MRCLGKGEDTSDGEDDRSDTRRSSERSAGRLKDASGYATEHVEINLQCWGE